MDLGTSLSSVAANVGTNRRTLIKVGAALGLVAALPGARSSAAQDVITISENEYPPENEPESRAIIDAKKEAFEAANPGIRIDLQSGGWDPETFTARLAAGDMTTTFMVPFTEPKAIISRGQSANVTEYVKSWENFSSFSENALQIVSDDQGELFGVPANGYLMGLLYRRDHFEEAGLDPETPPATWDEFRGASRKLKEAGHVAFAETSAENQGGWHFVAWDYSAGGQLETVDGDTVTATFADEKGVQVLEMLRAMRWDDGVMTDEQLFVQDKTRELVATGQVSMSMQAPDALSGISQNFPDVDLTQIGLGILPQNGGNATLAGGAVWMFNPEASPEELDAAVKWVLFRSFDLEAFEESTRMSSESGLAVGVPAFPLFTGEYEEQLQAITDKYSNLPVENYASFLKGQQELELRPEPPVETQQLYAAIDPVIQAVLTDESADPKALLEEAQSQFQSQILDQL